MGRKLLNGKIREDFETVHATILSDNQWLSIFGVIIIDFKNGACHFPAIIKIMSLLPYFWSENP